MTYTIQPGDFGFTDPNDNPANVLASVQINTLPAAGTLSFNGAPPQLPLTVTAADLASGALTYKAPANAFGNALASLTFQVRDDGGTLNGGADFDLSPNVLTFNVAAVNDAPSGANKTLTANFNTPYTFGTGDFGFSDATDAPAVNSLFAVQITTLPDPATGVLSVNGIPLAVGEYVRATSLASGQFVFTPAAGVSGNAAASFTFQVQDDGGTSNDGVDTDPAAKTITFNVLAGFVNHAPTGSDKTVNAFEETAYVFQSSDFTITDQDGNNLKAVKIGSLPASGTLTLTGSGPVSVGQAISALDISSGKFRYTGATNFVGAASFTFQVQDDGGTANGGQDTALASNTVNLVVANVNDAPAGINKVVALNEDGSFTFAGTDFGLTDSSDSPANTLAGVKLTTVPTTGSLKLGVNNVVAGQLIPVAQIGSLVFTPAANANGNNYASFTFQVQDNGGTANGGVDLDPSPNAFVINVTSVNDAPVGAGRTIGVPTSSTYAFTTADFGFTDPNDSPANNFLAVKIGTLPAAGTLQLNGVAVTTGQSILAINIANGQLTYAAGATAGTPTFTFQVQDDGGTSPGVDLSAAATMTMNVTGGTTRPNANRAPDGTSKIVNGFEDTTYVVSLNDFGFTDPNDTPADGFQAVKITALPASGTFTVNGSAVALNQVIPVGDITSGNLKFKGALNSTANATIGFQVQDNGGTATIGGTPGVDLDPTANTLTITLANVNDPPVGADKPITGLEDVAYTFAATDFASATGSVFDPNDTPANGFLAVQINSLPTAGALTINGLPVVAGQAVAVSDIQAGRLLFQGAPNASGNNYASFSFQVQDNGGVLNGGVDLDQTANTITLNLTAVNDAPTGNDRILFGQQDTPYTFSLNDFPISDANDNPANSLANVKIASLPTTGSLTLNNNPVTVGQAISAAAIQGNQFKFTPLSGTAGFPYDAFTFQVQDDGGTAGGGQDTAVSANSITFSIAASGIVNHEPAGADKSLTAIQGQSYTLQESDFGFSDPNDSPPNSLNAVRIATLPTGATLTNGGTPITVPGTLISVSDIASGKLLFQAPAAASNVFFTFQVQDNGGTAGGGQDTDQTANTLSFTVVAVNHAPTGANKTIPINEDNAYTFVVTDFGFNDADGNTLSNVIITSLPAVGTLTSNGSPVAQGAIIAASTVTGGFLKFIPPQDGNGAGLASFNFKLQDNGGTANNGADTSAGNAITFDVTAVNDAPSFTRGPDATATDEDGRSSAPVKTIPGWAKNLSAGPANEAGQTLNFIVTNDNNALFSQQPAIDAAGNLTFKPAPNAKGTAVVSVRIHDNGGVTGGGVDTSAIQTFNITVSKATPWHNTNHQLDVSGDNQVVAGDALAIINFINAFGAGRIDRAGATWGDPFSTTPGTPFGFLDTTGGTGNSGDNFIAPADALAVINFINAFGPGLAGPEGEATVASGGAGEGEGAAAAVASTDSFFYDLGAFGIAPSYQETVATPAPADHGLADVIALLASDTWSEELKRRRL